MLSPRDHYYPQFERFILEIAKQDVILDLGTYYAFRKELQPFEEQLSNARYYTMDYRVQIEPGTRPPDVDGEDVLMLDDWLVDPATGQPMLAPYPSDKRQQSTKNFELDRSISHTRQQQGRMTRLSVAVVVEEDGCMFLRHCVGEACSSLRRHRRVRRCRTITVTHDTCLGGVKVLGGVHFWIPPASPSIQKLA